MACPPSVLSVNQSIMFLEWWRNDTSEKSYMEEKRKMSYAKISLLCLFSCIFVFKFITLLNAPARSSTALEVATTGYTDAQDLSVSAILRERPPSSYCFKIESFSTFVKSQFSVKYESRTFVVGGYNWTLILYPKGNPKEGGSGYISLYLAIDNSSFVANPAEEVYTDLKFFVYNKLENKYLTVQDASVKRFHVLRTEWGFAQLLSLGTFNNVKNGYLYDDQCAFGVEVLILEPFKKWELTSFTENPRNGNFTWKIKKFSTLFKQYYKSDKFSVAGRNWSLVVYPRGYGEEEGSSLTLSLELSSNEKLLSGEKVYVRAKLRVLDQRQSKHVEKSIDNWYTYTGQWWGYSKFLSLDDLRDPSKGFLVSDTLITEVEIQVVSATKYFPS